MFQSLNWLEDEDVQFEKTCTKGLLTPEEIENLRFDESLSDFDRASLIFSDGQESQKMSLASQLPVILTSDPYSFSEILLLKFVEMTSTASTELLTVCGQCVSKLLTTGMLTSSQVVLHLTPLMWNNINSKDVLVHKTWLDTLITYILQTNRDVLTKHDVIKQALSKGNLSQKSSSRIACSKLITALSKKLDEVQMEDDVYPVIRMLCQDIDYDVRSAMCSSLVDIAQTIGEVRTVKLLIPEIRELLQDEEVQVRNTAITVLVDITPLLAKDVVEKIISPMLWPHLDIVICEKPSSTLVTVAKIFGRLGVNMTDVMDESRREWYVRYFIKLCGKMEHLPLSNGIALENGSSPALLDITMDSIDMKETDVADSIAYLCAFNFPAICVNVGVKAVLESGLLDSYTALSTHHHHSVRRVISAGIHEVARILSSESSRLLPLYKTLLLDSSLQVQAALVTNMSAALASFVVLPNKGSLPTTGLPDLIDPLLQHEANISKTREWRCYTSLIEAWSDFTDIMTPEQVYQNFAAHLLKQIHTNVVLPVKRAMLQTLVKYLHNCKYQQQRHDLITQIVKGLCKGRKFNQRLMFVELCYLVLQRFSKKFFKEYCFTPALLLVNDPIPCVRIKSCTLLPHLKSQLKMPSDRPMLQQLEASSRRSLMSERNKDVLSHIQQAVIELDRGDVRLDSECDEEDKRREDEQNLHIVKDDKNEIKSRISLPEISSLDLKEKRMSRKNSVSSLPDSDHSTSTSRTRRKMSHAALSARRSSTSVPRRASMPSGQLVDVVNKARTSHSVKLKAGKKG